MRPILVKQYGAEVANPWERATRLLCSFSCGAASAVATKLAIGENAGRLPVHIMYLDTKSEHSDNVRFRRDCEQWFGHPVSVYGSAKYADIWDVFEREKWIKGFRGAKCTTVLKKQIADTVETVDDLHVFGYHASKREQARAERLWDQQPEIMGWFPLIDAGLTKDNCFEILAQAGIALPAMYLLGFDNNNCIGCPKGGNEYWNNVRKHFPDVFVRMCIQSRLLGVKILKLTIDGARTRIFLDQLPEGATDDEPIDMSCGHVCQQQELELV